MRKPNYNFERSERERIKALKVAEKAAIKREQRERDRAASAESGQNDASLSDATQNDQDV